MSIGDTIRGGDARLNRVADLLDMGAVAYVGLSTGAGSTYTLTFSLGGGSNNVTRVPDGMAVAFRANHTNTGNSQLVVAGNTIQLLAEDGTTLSAGDIQSGQFYTARFYDSTTKWYLQGMSTSGSGGGTLMLSDFVYGETPTGTINGSNTVFTVANSFEAGTLQVFRGDTESGLAINPNTGFSETTATTFTMTVAPATGEVLWVNYVKQ